MNIWEDGTKQEVSETVVMALRCLAVGYPHIRRDHAALLHSFGLCYRASVGWALSEQGKACLAAWDAGRDYKYEGISR